MSCRFPLPSGEVKARLTRQAPRRDVSGVYFVGVTIEREKENREVCYLHLTWRHSLNKVVIQYTEIQGKERKQRFFFKLVPLIPPQLWPRVTAKVCKCSCAEVFFKLIT